MREKLHEQPLLDMPAGTLLHAFGTGGHKPGSGSAAAFIGSLAAQLTCNVIDLTDLYKKRSITYEQHLNLLRSHLGFLKSKLIPALDDYIEKDSAQFDKVIAARKDRNEERDPKLKAKKSAIAENELRLSTEMPIEIARYCYNVGRMAADVFDYGYRGARGESAEGVIFAAAAILSCLSIVELNLQTLPVDEWTEKIRKQKAKLYEQHSEIERMGKERHGILKKDADDQYEYETTLAKYRSGNMGKDIKTDDQMEVFVSGFLNFMWLNKERIWKKAADEMDHPIKMLKPDNILTKVLGYTYSKHDSLGRHYEGTDAYEIAGTIDKKNKKVQVSRNFSPDTIRFTEAHELGHAMLHPGTIMHRDRGIDGSHINRNPTERQADKFAAEILMPAKLVRSVFNEIFNTSLFTINQHTMFELGVGSMQAFIDKCENLRGLAREIATAKMYAHRRITPLHAIFGVSVETMAIRLEELKLIKFPR